MFFTFVIRGFVKKIIALLFLATFIPTQLFAWGPKGHAIVADIASSRLTPAARKNIQLLLAVTGLTTYMEGIASGEDVTRGKPDPQVFLLAFQRLGVSPRDGVVIEDAPSGVQAAIAAGAASVGITNTQTEQTLREAGADLVVPTLEGLAVRVLEDLVRRNRAADVKRET